MSELQITARHKIHPGKLEQYKACAAACVKACRERDTRTEQYDWFLNEEIGEGVARERYPDSEAIIEHIQNLADELTDLITVADVTFEIFGEPSKDLRKVASSMDVVVYSYLAGT